MLCGDGWTPDSQWVSPIKLIFRKQMEVDQTAVFNLWLSNINCMVSLNIHHKVRACQLYIGFILISFQTSVSLKRLQNFLKNEELDPNNVNHSPSGGQWLFEIIKKKLR